MAERLLWIVGVIAMSIALYYFISALPWFFAPAGLGPIGLR